jgi:hypothetical protein
MPLADHSERGDFRVTTREVAKFSRLIGGTGRGVQRRAGQLGIVR